MKFDLASLVKDEIAIWDVEKLRSKYGEYFETFFYVREGKPFLKDEFRKRVRVVLTGGVFDCFHYGHLITLKEAKKFGDLLVVVVARDETVVKYKGKKPLQDVYKRAEIISSLDFVDVALVGARLFEETIERVRPDVVVFGYDQKPFHVKGAKVVKLSVKVEGVKSSLLKKE